MLAVRQRTSEIGLRVALGAQPAQISRLVTRRVLSLTGAGIVVGVAGVLIAGQVVASFLFGVTPRDPTTLACVVILVGFAAVTGAWLPARRALRINPIDALRSH
jgi:ABC-type antimicrobial peptide transport system permease subunit